MKLINRSELELQLLYMDQWNCDSFELISSARSMGALGIRNFTSTNTVNDAIDHTEDYGIRIGLEDLTKIPTDLNTSLIVVPLTDSHMLEGVDDGRFKSFSQPVFIEVGSAHSGIEAERTGASAVIVKGNEGPGWVSERNGFVLLQEILQATSLPVYLQGGVNPRTARAAITAGAKGVVLDVHLALCRESSLDDELKRFFMQLEGPITSCFCEAAQRQLRIYSRVGARLVRELRKEEEKIESNDLPAFMEKLRFYVEKTGADPDKDDFLIPMSEDISIAREYERQGLRAAQIIEKFSEAMNSGMEQTWPFQEGSEFCKERKIQFPIVQGPMAHISDTPEFLGAVHKAGAAPVLPLGNMPTEIAQRALEDAKAATNGNFGVGIIGLEVNRQVYESHLEIMEKDPPPFAILAAGNVELAQKIESMGIHCYLHSPSPAMLEDALKQGHKRFVIEGCESGGHVGLMGSLTLWAQSLDLISKMIQDQINPQEITILLAGGIGGPIGAAFVAGMVGDLAEKGLKVGLQIGTKYLATKEAVDTQAITEAYQRLILNSNHTVILGRTVNTRARAAGSPMAEKLVSLEMERLRQGIKIRERKELYEQDNLGALRLAAKGCKIDPKTAGGQCPIFMEIPSEEQVDQGLYLMGQVVSMCDRPITMEGLHTELTRTAKEIFEENRANGKKPIDKPQKAEPNIQEIEPRTVVDDLREEPIAVVGLGLRLPGSSTPSEYWEQILNLKSGIIDAPDERWKGVGLFYDPDPKAPDKSYSKIGGFITDFTFDPLERRIPPSVAANMDRTQQIAVSAVGDALKDAGLTPDALKDKRVGTVIGNSMGGEKTDQYATRVSLPSALEALGEALEEIDISQGLKKDLLGSFKREYLRQLPEITEDSLPGELPNIIAGRVANVFNLTGPNFTVDAACASSIAAVMNGISLLRSRSADLVISGGVDAAMGPSSFIKFCKIGALSPDGSRPFDASANGFVMGEGAGIMVLKRLEDAVKDHDRIYGLIVGVGSSSDGRGKGITAPNAEGQKRAIRNCLESSGVDLGSIGLVEAHGTSTSVGDKTELMVLDDMFKGVGCSKGSVGLGSVKSLIGHLKAAAGAAGMIKAILALHNKTLPPTANVKDPNPCIDWNESPLKLISEPMEWQNSNSGPRRASASAFGFGGANFHVVLQEYSPDIQIAISSSQVAETKEIEAEIIETEIPDWPTPKRMVTQAQAWCFGAKDYDDFAERLNELEGKLTESNWSDLAVLSTKSALPTPLRCGFATIDYDDSIKKIKLLKEALKNPRKRSFLPARGIHLTSLDEARTKAGVALVFPGQGSQYTYMLRDLAQRFPVVAQTLMDADKTLESLGVTKATSLMFPDTDAEGFSEEEHESAMKDTKLLQPLILTANVAIFRALCHMGLDRSVTVVAGHSLGEYAACVASGAMSLEDALRAVSVRGKEMANVSMSDPGCMMSVPAEASFVEDVLSRVNGYVVAANKNSPKQTVISGETPAVRAAAELFKEKGLDVVLVPVSAAFHSAVVASAREPFMKTLKSLDVKAPKIPVISNVTGAFYPVGPGAADQIRDLLAKQFAAPVEWIKTIRRMYNEGVRIFVECGPKRVLTALGRDTLDKDALFLATNHPKKGGVVQLLETAAALKAEGIPIDINMEAKAKNRSAEILTESKSEEVFRGTIERATDNIARQSATEIDGNGSLKPLMDAELTDIASKPEFSTFMELQGAPIRDFIKSGYANFVEKILPLEKTKRTVESQGMDFKPVVVSGMSAGLPGETRFPFDKECLDDLIKGHNFIKRAPKEGMRQMLAKNIERLVKGASGEAELQKVENENDVIRLAGYFSDDRILEEYGVEQRMINAMDATTRLALAAGVEALKDAKIPLVLETRRTTTGKTLPDAWRLPKPLQEETGVIFASAFPGISSVVDEVTREVMARYSVGAKDRLIKFYTGLIERMEDSAKRNEVTEWFTREFSDLNGEDKGEVYSFNRDFLFRVMTMAPGQLAQFIKAKGPNTHVNAACASTTQAIVMARDWIRTGAAKRVIVVAADDVAGATLLPWVGGGFLAMGAATTQDKVSEAALPFDARRNGVILGSAAVGFVLESESIVRERGVTPMVSVEAGILGNSAFHGTRLDPDHIASLMDKMVSRWEKESGHSREELSKDALFMSHETYSPKRGGSSAAEIYALRRTFGKGVVNIPIANTKGFTGHTMGVGVEDAVAMRCLQKGMAPPIPNLKSPDPDFADLKLGPGGPCEANYALRLAAGFGSQIVMSLYKVMSRQEDRLSDPETHNKWLKEVTGYDDTETFVEQRILRVRRPEESQMSQVAPESAADLVTDIEKIEDEPSPAQETFESQETVDSLDTAGIQERIVALLAAKTGYPAEMLDPDLDLEADLGIDTVKQAEFITEVREEFGIPQIKDLKIADFPTIKSVSEFVAEKTDAKPAGKERQPENTTAGSDQAESDGATVGAQSPDDIQERILGLLSKKTGYPSEMLDLDLDLEADLGIDTVKQAEFITEVREEFNIPQIKDLKVADFPTIAHIMEFVRARVKEEESSGDVKRPKEINVRQLNSNEEVKSYNCRLISINDQESESIDQVDEIHIIGGPKETAKAVKKAFQVKFKATVHVSAELKPKDSITKKSVGIVNLIPLGPSADQLTETLKLYIALSNAFESGPVFLITVVSEDGEFGFKRPSSIPNGPGAVMGATKAFSREFKDTTVNAIDMSPALSPGKQAEEIVKTLTHRRPLEIAIGADRSLNVLRLAQKMVQAIHSSMDEGSVILATGGAKGITAECLKSIAKDARCKFILFGRTPLTPKSKEASEFSDDQWREERDRVIEAMKRNHEPITPVRVERELGKLRSQADVYTTIKELESLGSQVMYKDLDILGPKAPEAVKEFILESLGENPNVDLIIHGAGIDQSKALKSKTMEQMGAVIGTKLQGFAHLMDGLESANAQIKGIVGFGSVSGRFGNVGQVDYSAANDGLAHYLRYVQSKGIPAKIIDWAPWSNVGMASSGTVQQSLEAAGIDFISPDKGVEIFKNEIFNWSEGFEELVVCGGLGPFTNDAFHVQGVDLPENLIFAGQQANVTALIPNEFIRAEVILDPSHPLLDHHRIDGTPVLPGVGGIEMMRSAAAIVSGLENPEITNVKFTSPLKLFNDEFVKAEVMVGRAVGHGQCSESVRYRARIVSRFIGPDGLPVGPERLHHQCEILYAKQEGERDLSGQAALSISARFSSWVPMSGLYRRFFHGPGFRFLNRISFDGSKNVVGFSFRDTIEREQMFNDILPAYIEAIFQASAGLAMERTGAMALPIGMESCTIHKDLNEAISGVVELREEFELNGIEGRKGFKMDGEIHDSDHGVVASFRGVELASLSEPESSSPWGASPWGNEKVYEEIVELGDVEGMVSENDESAISLILNSRETDGLNRAKTHKRKVEWLGGRLAAKRAINRLLFEAGKPELPMNSVALIPDQQGKPVPTLVDNSAPLNLRLTISHSNGAVIAAVSACPKVSGIGVDMEKVEKRNPLWERDYFTQIETDRLNESMDRDLELTMIWSIKEAVLKSVGTGLRYDMKDIVVKNIEKNGSADLEITGVLASNPMLSNERELFAWAEVRKDMVIARTLLNYNNGDSGN